MALNSGPFKIVGLFLMFYNAKCRRNMVQPGLGVAELKKFDTVRSSDESDVFNAFCQCKSVQLGD